MNIDWNSIIYDVKTGNMTMNCPECGDSVDNMSGDYISAWTGAVEISDEYLLHTYCASEKQIETYYLWASGEGIRP